MDRIQVDFLAQKIWDYHHLNHELKKADCILVLGSHDSRIGEYGAKLFLDGWAPLIVFSGGLGRLTQGLWDEPEADKFARIAVQAGVPQDKILIENRSTNTGENVLFTKALFAEKGMNPEQFIVVHKPYMERRAYATFKKVWPEKSLIVTSPPISFEDYPNGVGSKEEVIGIMVGDLQRIKLYAERGYQIPQIIPTDVWDAFERLVQLGFNTHLTEE
ncbi:MAG TPA: YdcF family protein [Terriglobia bacterium]|nr:YdcF family protein [Terriglobia bacterium]